MEQSRHWVRSPDGVMAIYRQPWKIHVSGLPTNRQSDFPELNLAGIGATPFTKYRYCRMESMLAEANFVLTNLSRIRRDLTPNQPVHLDCA